MKELTQSVLVDILADYDGQIYFGTKPVYYWRYGQVGLSLFKLIGNDFKEIAHCSYFRNRTLKEINAELLDSSQEIASQF